MAIIRAKEVVKMSQQERDSKLSELRLELVKGQVAAKKATAKTKELKRAVARLLTFKSTTKEVPAKS